MKAVKVRKEFAEKVRLELEKSGLKDKKRRIRFENGYVIIPVIDDFESESHYFEIIDDQNPVFMERKNFREIIESVAGFYPRFADIKIFGDVAIIKLPDSVLDHKQRIAEEVTRNYGVKAVWLDKGRHGMIRKPNMENLVGEKSIVEIKENGCIFRFDITKVMFSQGNQFEKMRISRLIGEGEIVLDMFSGIGYFTIPIAVHSKARKIYSIEINPDSYNFLLDNLKLNNVKNVIPILGDSMHVSPESIADRVIMGHIYCHEFIPVAIRAINDEGCIHYHEAVPRKILERPLERIKKEAEKLKSKVLEISMRKVKNYSPGVYHVVVDAKIKRLSK